MLRILGLLIALAAAPASATVFHLEDAELFNGGTVTGYFVLNYPAFDKATVTRWDLTIHDLDPGTRFETSSEMKTAGGQQINFADISFTTAYQPMVSFHADNILGAWLTLPIDASARIDGGILPLDTTITGLLRDPPMDPNGVIVGSRGDSEAWHDGLLPQAIVSGHLRIQGDFMPHDRWQVVCAVPELQTVSMLAIGCGWLAWSALRRLANELETARAPAIAATSQPINSA